MNKSPRSFLLVLAAVLLAGCETLPPIPKAAAQPEEPLIIVAAPRRGVSGGVLPMDTVTALTSDSRAFRAGDVLTVVLQETTQASKRSGVTSDKNSSTSITPFLFRGRSLKTDIGIDAQRSSDAGNTATQQNALQGAITVVVTEVLPNGLLAIRGEKSLTLNLGEEFIRVTGFARVADIDTDNRLSSQRIANARITYSGRGTLAESQRQGWLTAFFNSPWMPF
ncbi:flagellar basal body L-ring protein FlgH [Pseudorhodoferax sp. Leaf265]|jgi:flagellar L-ring protein precursor FlgH|uniref:flagellar basal body L-ring protein FlgH n=1 Tax=Pseudorhodoferax sp. Leaf265 TaxID=1736315 RepID=UPI0006F242A6|nr:flagellar basal body L-ring protein FlgH [Pseudorhodoferax sp. Leaf265]KQP06453.1 flagellar basal body L-ring protein [Pseudorhodoferax sp. Leaf265]PZQ03288.1 MAG: flagellar basal body L-ring protein [Variovorax paradoxus]PZQ17562.1 MAG: flagellar basal body L-ring protein [Variovorax paradoxus]